jgi:ankyrin repeat protein
MKNCRKIYLLFLIVLFSATSCFYQPQSRENKILEANDYRELEKVKTILANEPSWVNSKDNDGNTPLHDAAFNGYNNVCAFMILKGAEVDAKNNDKATALHFAAFKGHADVVKLLISKGANVNSQKSKRLTPLHEASGEGHAEVVEILLDNNAIKDAIDGWGRTPLHVVASTTHKDAAKILICKGADRYAPGSYNGKRPADVAKGNPDKEMAKLFEPNGCQCYDGGPFEFLFDKIYSKK